MVGQKSRAGPLFRVTDVTHVTRKWAVDTFLAHPLLGDLDLSLELQRKVGVGHFL
nr:MAG TPA: hypothetical protein [Caudoviricetes sp.]